MYKFDDEAVVAKLFVDVALPKTAKPRFALAAKRFDEDAVVAKIEVEVELVVVERSAVKLFRVVDPLTKRLDEVTDPVDVTFPAFRFAVERLVDDALVAKKLVVVALVPVARVKVKA